MFPKAIQGARDLTAKIDNNSNLVTASGAGFAMDMLAVPVCRLFPDTGVAHANGSFRRAFGYAREELAGQRLVETAEPGHRSKFDALAALRPDSPTVSFEAAMRNGSGDTVWATWQCRGEFDSGGRLEVVTAFVRIATAEMRHRTALEQLLQVANRPELSCYGRARAMLDVCVDYFGSDASHIVRIAEDGTLTVSPEFSPAGTGLLDTPARAAANTALDHAGERQEIIAIEDLARPGTAAGDGRRMPEGPAEGDPRLAEGSLLAAPIYVGQRRAGLVMFVTQAPRRRPFPEEHAQLCMLLAQWLGFILEQNRNISEIKGREDKYRTLFRYSPVMIYTTDDDDRITDVNQSWQDAFGYAREEVIGRPASDFYTDRTEGLEEAEDAPDDGEDRPLRLMRNYVARNGAVVEAQVSMPRHRTPGMPMQTVMVDVSERNRVLRGLTRIRATLTQANEGLKRFNTIAAHDLQEPLRKIRLFGGLLKDSLGETADPEIETAIDKIMDAANRLTTLVKDLLLYSREGERSYARQPIALNGLFAEVVEDLAISIGETRAEVVVSDLPMIMGDPVPVHRLFTNLVLNALKYHRKGVPPHIEIFTRQDDSGTTELVLRDQGVGLRPGEETVIFNPFVRARPHETPGSGIGLAICKAIVDGHGWTIRAENRESGGADFVVTFGHDTLVGGAAGSAAAGLERSGQA